MLWNTRWAIEFIRPHELVGVDRDDAHWTRMIHRYVSNETAELEVSWLQLEDDGFTYRVIPVQGDA
jgi:hypothetical protein